jgi:CHAT domain-containing protein/uncharacterized protein HemY
MSSVTKAQESPSTEKVTVYFKVWYVMNSSDSILALISGTTNLTKGLNGKCVKTYKTGEDRDDSRIGDANVAFIRNDTAVCLVKLYKTGVATDSIQYGDIISFDVPLAKQKQRSIFFDMQALNIVFTDIDKKPFYSLRSLLKDDGRKVEDSILKKMRLDIVATYESYNALYDSSAAVKKPLAKGRYKNKTVLDVMRNATNEDVLNFLFFVKSYPGKYMGHEYKISQTFATWVLNFGLTSSFELSSKLLPVWKDKVKFTQLVTKLSASIKDEKFVSNIADEAIAEVNKENFEEAFYLIRFGADVGHRVKDTAGLGKLYLVWAQMEQDRKNYEKAVPLCDTAIYHATLSREYDYELQSHYKKVYCLYKLLQFEKAKQAVAIGSKRRDELENKITPQLFYKYLGKGYQYAGWVNYEAGEFNQAIENLNKANAVFRRLNSFDAWRDIGSNYNYIGLAYREQGIYKDARIYYDSSYAVYKKLNDENTTAVLLNGIGYLYFMTGDYDSSMLYHKRAFDRLITLENYNEAGYSKSQIAQCLWNKGDYTKAIESHYEAIAFRKKSNNASGEAFSWEMLGSLYKLTGDKTQALLSYDSAAYHYSRASDSTGIIKSLNYVGEVYKNDKNFKRAVEYYEKAMQLATKLNRKAQLAQAYFNIADASYYYDTAKAKIHYTKCLDLSRTTGDRINEFYSLVNLGVLANRQYSFAKGKSHFASALTLTNFIENKKDIAYCYSRIGEGFVYELDFVKSDEYYAKAFQVYDSAGSISDMGFQLLNLGSNALSKGNFNQSASYYERALRLGDSSANNLLQGVAYNSQAFLHQLQGEVNKGIVFNDSAMAVFKRSGNNTQLADSYVHRGILFNAKSEFAAAITAYLVADSLYELEKMTDPRTTVANNIGNVYYFQADYKKALDYFKEAEKKLRPGVIDELYMVVKSNIAECYYYIGDLQRAKKELELLYPVASSKNAWRMMASVSLVLGKVYVGFKDHTQATKYLRIAEEYANKSGEKEKLAEASLYLGKSLMDRNIENEGLAYLKQAADVSTQFGFNKLEWESLYEIGLVKYNKKEYDSSVSYFKKAIELVEKNAGNLFGGEAARKVYEADTRKVDLYTKIIASLATLQRNEEAWLYANKSNNAALKEKIGIAAADDPRKNNSINEANRMLQQKNALDKSISEIQGGKNAGQNEEKLKALQRKKEVIETDYLNYVSTMIEEYPDLDTYFAKNVNPEDLKKYKDKIPVDVAILLYLINDRQLYIFTVTNERISIRIDSLDTDINALINNYQALLNLPDKASGTGALTLRSKILREKKSKSGLSFTETSEQLYHILIDDIKPEIAGKKKLCIVPNGKLSNIPFQCLGMRMPDSSFRFMVEDYSIFYTNKLDIFLEKGPVPGENIGSLIAFGNPDKSLPSAEEEVKEINKIVLTANVYTQQEATEGRAKHSLENNKYLHFATHGVLDYTDFKKSYLKFVPGRDGQEDGNLTIAEIKRLAINGCELVTLSACETAVTQELTKGWYVSPANSFLINRVKTVVASLWSVDDGATSVLMKEFYKNLQTMEKAEALRQAQQTLSRNPKYVHPFYWGAFVLYGDWR